MLIFGLHSTSDHQPGDLSDQSWPKLKKKKWSFLDYVQLLMISCVI